MSDPVNHATMTSAELVLALWAKPSAAKVKAQKRIDEVSEEERARRVNEYRKHAPSPERMDELQAMAGRGEITRVRRVGRGAISYLEHNAITRIEGVP